MTTQSVEIVQGDAGAVHPVQGFLGRHMNSPATLRTYARELEALAILAGCDSIEIGTGGKIRKRGEPYRVPWETFKPEQFHALFVQRVAQPTRNGEERAKSCQRLTASVISGLADAMRRAELIDLGKCAEIKDLPLTRYKRLPPERSLRRTDLRRLAAMFKSDRTPAGRRDAAIILAVGTGGGLRCSEITALDLADLDGRKVRVLRGKGSKQRTVCLSPDAHGWLDPWLEVRGADPGPLFLSLDRWGNISPKMGRLVPATINRICKERAEQAGIDHFSPHAMRRGCANLLRHAGWDMEQIRDHLGHESIATTGTYFRVTDEERLEASSSPIGIPPCYAEGGR